MIMTMTTIKSKTACNGDSRDKKMNTFVSF